MKTKLIILMAAITAIVYSCSADRDENITPTSEKTSKQELKLNKKNLAGKDYEQSVYKDTIIVRSLNSLEADVTTAPLDGGDPTTITPPKR